MSQPQNPYPPYYPPQPLPHSHDKYVAGIIVGALVALVIGGIIGFAVGFASIPPGTLTRTVAVNQNFTLVSGTVNIGSAGTPRMIYFDSQNTGTMTSVITTFGSVANSYQLYLPSGNTYTMTIYYQDSVGGWQHCSARPGVFAPSGSQMVEDFLC